MGEGATQMHNHICITYFKGNLFTSEYFFIIVKCIRNKTCKRGMACNLPRKIFISTTYVLLGIQTTVGFSVVVGTEQPHFFLLLSHLCTPKHGHTQSHLCTLVHIRTHPHPPAHILPHALNLINHMKLFLNKKSLHQFNFI